VFVSCILTRLQQTDEKETYNNTIAMLAQHYHLSEFYLVCTFPILSWSTFIFFSFVTGTVNFASFPFFRLRILAKLLSAKFLHREIRYVVKKKKRAIDINKQC